MGADDNIPPSGPSALGVADRFSPRLERVDLFDGRCSFADSGDGVGRSACTITVVGDELLSRAAAAMGLKVRPAILAVVARPELDGASLATFLFSEAESLDGSTSCLIRLL